MSKTFNPQRSKLLAAIGHLTKMLHRHRRPARYCRRAIKKLRKRLTRLNSR
jgi:hypothetical protein